MPFLDKKDYLLGCVAIFSKKRHLKAITAKSEENGLCLKVNFTLHSVSYKCLGGLLVEKFSKTTAAKEKDRTSVIFHDKTTNGQNFRTKLRTALPNSLDYAS